YNSRMDEIQAALLRVKLPHLADWTVQRRRLASLYRRHIGEGVVALPEEPARAHHVYHLFVIRSAWRDQLRQALAAEGIGSMIHYPVPVHLQEGYRDLGYGPGSLPVTEAYSDQILSLPLYPELPESAAVRVAAAVREFAART
ncbi:MAG: DegT/DnrJ/EryC1/StrS family aminotransferase, partial [Chloroflexi bacterium]|nr:DegT/DnrJ/EryC1/StrS family aminotransferase [Chloroflexota bacterium]